MEIFQARKLLSRMRKNSIQAQDEAAMGIVSGDKPE